MPLIDDPITSGTPILNPPLANEFNFPRERTTPGWGEVMAAEFETNNIIGSISADQSAAFSRFQGERFDPTFSLADELRGTRWETNPGLFVTARSREHVRAIQADLERDERTRRTLEDSSWAQWIPAMVLGQATDPINWLSLGTLGALRLAGRGGMTLARRTGAIAVGTALDTTAQEIILRASQQNRTVAESVTNIGGSLLIGGLIGHVGSRLLLRSEVEALSRLLDQEMVALDAGRTPRTLADGVDPLRGNLSGDTAGVGAQRMFNADGTPSPRLKFSFGMDYLSQRMGPQQRLTHSSSDAARRFANEMIETPYFYRENRDGFIVAPRGDALGMPGAVQTRIGAVWEEPIMRAVYGMRDLYLQYRGAEHQNIGQRAAFNVRERLGMTGGALSEVDFRRAVYEAVNNGGSHPIPQVATAARAVLDLAKQVEASAIKAGVLKEGQSAIPRSWLTARITGERPRFRQIVVEHLKRRRSQFEGEWEGISRERAVKAAEDATKREEAAADARFEAEMRRERDKALREAERETPLRYTGLPLMDDEIDALADFWTYMREVFARKKPESLSSFVVRMGGLEDPGGDVLSIIGGYKARPGLIRKGPDQSGPGMAGLGARESSGKSLDDWALRAWEQGFFPDHIERPSINDFLDRLADDLGNGRVVRQGDEVYFDDLKIADEYAEELAGYGINPRDFRSEASFREYFGQRRPKRDADAGSGTPKPAEAREPTESKLTAEQERVRTRALMNDAELNDLANTIIERMTLVREGRTAHDLHRVREKIDGIEYMRDDATLTADDFNLPFNEARDFLEQDTELLLRLMHRSMIPDVEIAHRFGSADAGDAIRARIEEGTRRINLATTPKERQRLQREMQRDIDDMAAVRDRLTGRYGLPTDPASYAVRGGRLLRDVSVVQKMGLAAFTSIPETARLITARGVGAIFADLIYPMMRDWRRFIDSGHDIRMATHALDHYSASRAMAIADGAEDWGSLPKVDRFSREATKTFMRATGLPKLTDWQKTLGGVLVSKSILEAAEATRAGTATRKQTEMLSRLAISRERAITIAEQFERHGVKDDSRMWAAEANNWDPDARAARDAFLGGIRREVNRLITTPGLDTPNMLNSEWGRLIAQFKSFFISAYERVLVSGLQQNDIAFWSSVVASIGIAFLVNEGRKAIFESNSGRRQKSFEERWNDPRERNQMFIEAVDRSGVLGWLPEINQVMDRVGGIGLSSAFGHMERRPGVATVGDAERQLFGAGLQSGIETGLVALKAARSILGPDRWSETDTRRLERVIPFIGLHWMRIGLEQMGAEEAVNRALNARKSNRQ